VAHLKLHQDSLHKGADKGHYEVTDGGMVVLHEVKEEVEVKGNMDSQVTFFKGF